MSLNPTVLARTSKEICYFTSNEGDPELSQKINEILTPYVTFYTTARKYCTCHIR